ncbi:PRC and DUF2382 domain-containing protein [Deinococcus humi]|uniref:Uncharacterized protein (TIGR02271 family) n=1 Tax=Deinococcus humi TaxID=662880 RepID=A0A7W8K1Y2_9DEIO|nr:DUF2382 domain-containing protein [Deinococcus humi]MBB5365784.1 uncharacterized protein (TIGR02271 family) [Deinococcus humi]GGO41057.1 hypothetical protein GCM10008949_51330 [Deinococcus humi]
MTQMNLVRMSELDRDHQLDLNSTGVYNPRDNDAYGANGEKIGTVRDALVRPTTGEIQYLIVDVGGWFSSKQVLIPVGQARFSEDGAYFDGLTKEQASDLSEYQDGQVYEAESQLADERVLRAPDSDEATYRREAFTTPDTLKLLEERLMIHKERFVAGSVDVGKRVETRQQQVNVELEREEVVIERHAVTDARPVEGAVLGADSQTLRVDLEAERANVSKQTFVTEEVTVGKREVTDTQTVSETVGKEVLEVTKSGDVQLDGEGQPRTEERKA